jgi:hypothetical protein
MAARDSMLELKKRIGESIIGQEAVIDRLLIALLADGHVLMEGLPGLAKTRTIKTLAKSLDSEFRRIQFTPDLLPADVTGSEIYYDDGGKGSFRFLPGPIFGNLVLADEINRAPAKVTARTRTPHSRVFTEERERPVLLLVDQRIGMFFGSVRMMKSVAAAEAAALVAWRTVAVKDRVGAVVFNDSEVAEIRPQRTRSTVMRLLRTLEKQNRALRVDSPMRPNPGMLNEALRRASRLATHDFLVFLISAAGGRPPRPGNC